MRVIKRRAALVSLGALASGTVAVATLGRKPPPAIAMPLVPPRLPAAAADAPHDDPPADDAPHVRLQTLAALVPTDPPRPLPDLRLIDGDGAAHALGEFAGIGIVLNLWATWCVPCVAELPALAALAARGAASGILVLPLSSDRGGAEVVRRYYGAHALAGLPVWIDPKGEAARALGARGIPTTLVIDRQGRERGRLEGAADWASDDALARLRELVS